MENFLLLTGSQVFVVIGDAAVFAFLLLVITLQSIVKQLMVYLLDWLILVDNIIPGTFSVYIFRGKSSAVVL